MKKAELQKALEQYKQYKQAKQEAEKALKLIEEAIKKHMGDKEEITCEGVTIRWKSYEQSRFDTTSFKQEHKVLYNKYCKKISAKRFAVN